MLDRRTKIVATLGPATDAPGVLDALVAAGLDCARLNCSHGDHDDLRRRAAAVRDGVRARRAPARPAVRPAGAEAAALGGDRAARRGGRRRRHVRRPNGVVVDFDKFTALVTERSQIVIGDGVPRFVVEREEGADVIARAISPGPLAPRKGINVTYARPELPAITEKDKADLALAAELGADFVALSFVRSAADIEQLRTLARDLRSTRPADREDREDRGLRGAGRDHRRRRRPDGRPRRLRRRGGRRARAADAEGHDPARDAERASS